MADTDNDKEQWANKRVDKFVVVNQKLGEGAFGKVYRGFFADDETSLVAAKAIPIKDISNSNKMLELIKREIQILQKIKNKYIVKLYDVARTNHNLYLFFEYCSDGDLKKYLEKKQNRTLSENEACLFMRHICEGFKTLYSEKIIHRDIKPANILLHQGIAKISDFGFAKQIEHGMNQLNYLTRLGSPLYMGPQILDNQKFSAKCDIWSVGIVFYEMLYGRTPWTGENQVKLLSNIKKQKLELPETPKRSDAVKDLLTKMLCYEEGERLTWDDVFTHQLICGHNSPTSSQIDFNDPATKNQMYVKQNLVAGYLNQEIDRPQTMETQSNEMSQNKSQQEFKSRQSILDTSQATLVLLEQTKMRNKILKINELVLYQRNIGFFFNYVTIQLVKDKKNGSLKIENHLFVRLLYIVSKNQIMEQNKTLSFIQSENNPDIKDWNSYKQSPECAKTLQIIKNDCSQSSNFFIDISKQTDEEFSNLKKKQQDPKLSAKIDKFSKIINNNFNRQEQKEFMEIYKETLNEYIELIKPLIVTKKLDKNQLKFARYVVICLNPYEIFKPEQYQSFDFNCFYEEMEAANDDQIITFLTSHIKI